MNDKYIRGEDRLLDQIADLTVYDVDDLRKEKSRLQARAVLAKRSQAARQPLISFLARCLEPALVSGFSILVFAWTVERILSLFSL